ncbi:MAG: DUF2568 domain-containing protein [Acidimicrobiia bacterium]|nr:DUF2568 domain-containing protein [Acidimicrobiia bacterium]
MTGVRGFTSKVRFICELGMLAGYAYWAFHTRDGASAWLLGIGTPLVVAAIWWAFVTPKAKWPVATAVRLGIEVVLFGGAVAALIAADEPVLGALLAVAALLTSPINNANVGTPSPTR